MNKTKIGFCFAFGAITLLSVFIYLGYPEEWRTNPIGDLLLVSQHVIGIASLAAIFIFYRKLPPDRLIKRLISQCGSIYYIFMLNMFVITLLKFGIKLIYDMGIKSERFSFIEFLENDNKYEIFGMCISYLIAFIGFFNANRTFMRRYTLDIDKPSKLESLNIILLADIHMGAGTWAGTFDKLTFIMGKTHPDIILIAGDLIDETTADADMKEFRQLISTLDPKYGIYFTCGNHDINRPEYIELIRNQTNIHILNDEKVMIEDIQLIGRPDYKSEHILPENLNEKLDIDPNKPVIVLQHRPNEFLKLDDQNYDLVMTGHTHGFNLAQSMNICINSDLVQGKKKYKNMTAIVTSGVSGWGFHYKFPAISEIVNIRINFKKET